LELVFEGGLHRVKVGIDDLQEMIGWISHWRAGVVACCKKLLHQSSKISNKAMSVVEKNYSGFHTSLSSTSSTNSMELTQNSTPKVEI